MPKKTKRPEPISAEQSEMDAAIASLGSGEMEMPDMDAELARMDRENPLDAVPETDDSEHDTKQVVSAALAAFKNQAANEAKIFQDNTDTEYWFAVCFQNRDQKEAFLKAVKWGADDKYLDGQKVAKAMGIALPDGKRKFNTGEKNRSMTEIGIIPTKPKK